MSLLWLVAVVHAGEPAPPASTSGPASTAAATQSAAPPCDVEVVDVLADERFRGQRLTPAFAAILENMSPESLEFHHAESHASTYRQCTYTVVVNGQRYRFVDDWDTTLEDKPDDWCEQARAEVATSIRTATAQCTDLHRGAYWGSDLVPLPATDRPPAAKPSAD